MEKYVFLQSITRKYLHGDLSKLKMEYENDDSTVVDVIYEDDNKYSFDYKIEVNNSSQEVKFITHYCNYCSDQIILKRFKRFESALCNCLFKH